MIDYILLNSFLGLFIKGNLRRGYIVSIVLGSVMVIKLLGYIIIVNLIKIYLSPFNGFTDFSRVDILQYVFIGVAAAGFGFLQFIRKKIVKNLQIGELKREYNIERLLLLSAIIYFICESIVILGFLLFLIAGRTLNFYFFLLLGLVCLGIYFPKYGKWEEWIKIQEAKKPEPKKPIPKKPILPGWVGIAFIFFVLITLASVAMMLFRSKQAEVDEEISRLTKSIETADKEVSEIADAYYNRGKLFENSKGERDKALSDYTKAIELNPSYVDAYYTRGYAYYFKGQYDKAIADFTKAIEINPGYAKAYYSSRGSAYYAKGQYDKACSDWRQGCELGSCWSLESAKKDGYCK